MNIKVRVGPHSLQSTSDLATRTPNPRGILVFGAHPPDSLSSLGSSQARAIPHTLFTFMNNNTQDRILYNATK